jgi:hypothetical protein
MEKTGWVVTAARLLSHKRTRQIKEVKGRGAYEYRYAPSLFPARAHARRTLHGRRVARSLAAKFGSLHLWRPGLKIETGRTRACKGSEFSLKLLASVPRDDLLLLFSEAFHSEAHAIAGA